MHPFRSKLYHSRLHILPSPTALPRSNPQMLLQRSQHRSSRERFDSYFTKTLPCFHLPNLLRCDDESFSSKHRKHLYSNYNPTDWFNITAGVYAYIWIRGVLFGYSAQVRSKLLLLATQIFAFLMTNLFEIAIRTKYGSILNECSYISHTGLLLISSIFAFISIGFLAFGAETAGFVLSLPISYIFWKPASLMGVIGWIVEYSGGKFTVDNAGSPGCPYVQLDLMLWTLPFVLWFFFSLLMSLVRFVLLRRAEYYEALSNQIPEPVEEGSPLKKKVFGKHPLPVRIAEERNCSICWEEFIDDQNVSFVDECFHIYHSSCINKWITHGSQCPLCKRKIKAETAPELPMAEN